MTSLPAVVTIGDLPTGTTISGSELLMAVQTSGGVGNSIQVPISQIATTALGALPTGGGTGQVLQKSSGTNFVSSWVNPSSFITIGTGLAIAGSTSLTISRASTVGLSVLGVAGTASAVPLAIAGTGAQVLVINDAGTGLAFGPVNLASAAAVTGILPNASYSAVNLGSTGAGGVQGILPYADMAARPQRLVTTTPITISTTDYIINCNIGTVAACTLPNPATRSGAPITFKDVGGQFTTHNLTISSPATALMDGTTSIVLNGNYMGLTLVPRNDGTTGGWMIL
jgi:hypothetical protein